MVDLKGELQELEKLRDKLYKMFPSYITHIRFPRYKNIATDAKIDFTFPITALVGSNGSGKTSVLNDLYGAPIRHSESPRDLRRLQLLREWSHEQVHQVFPRSP